MNVYRKYINNIKIIRQIYKKVNMRENGSKSFDAARWVKITDWSQKKHGLFELYSQISTKMIQETPFQKVYELRR